MSTHERAKALTEARAQVWSEAAGFLKRLKGRQMSVAEQHQWDRYNERIDALAVEVDELQTRERNEVEAAQIREAQGLSFGSDPAPSGEREFFDFLAGRGPSEITVPVMRAARERQLVRQGASPQEIRALAWDTGSAASAVPTSMSRALFETLEAEISMLRAPTMRITTSGGESMDFPTVASHSVATQVAGQGTLLAGTDPDFGKLTLTPYKYGQLVSVANEVLSDSGIDMGAFLARNLGRSLGRVIDTDLVTGTGSGQPTGVMVAAESAGSVITGGSLITPDYENLIDVQYSVNDAYRASGASGWLMRDSTAGTLRKLRDQGGTIGTPIWSPSTDIVAGTPDTLLGYPVWMDANVAAQGSDARCIAFVDFSSYYLRTVGDPVIERDSSVLFTTDQTAFRGKWRVDGNLADSNAIASILMNV